MISLSAVAMGLVPLVLECPKLIMGEDHGVGFGEGSNLSTRTKTFRVMGFPRRRYLHSSWHRLGELGVFPRVWYLQAVAE